MIWGQTHSKVERTMWYRCSSKRLPMMMLSRIESASSHGSCGASAHVPHTSHKPPVSSMSPRIAKRTLDLDEPLGPVSTQKLPYTAPLTVSMVKTRSM